MVTSGCHRLALTLCTTAAICVGVSTPASAAQTQSPAFSGLDWSQSGGPLFPASQEPAAKAVGESLPKRETQAHQILTALEAMADPEIVWDEAGGPDAIKEVGPLLRLPSSSQPFDQIVETAAGRHGFDPKLLHALIAVESAYRPQAVSPAGAAGLAQLMPGTARDLGVRDRFDPADNLNGAAAYLAEQLLRFGDMRLALAAYNAGPQRVARLGRIPEIAETRAYVFAVTECFLALSAGRRIRSRNDCSSPGSSP